MLLLAFSLPLRFLAQFTGGSGRGDHQFAIAGIGQSQFLGGSGRGDVGSTLAGIGRSQFQGGIGRGDVQLAVIGIEQTRFRGGIGRGDIQLTLGGIGQTQFSGGFGRGDVQLALAGIGRSQFMGGIGRGDVTTGFWLGQGAQVQISLRGVLEGPYSTSTGLMNDALRSLPSFSLTEPYSALGYAQVLDGGVTLSPTVLAATGNDAIVDWVVVELRNANTPTTIDAARCALLQRDGDVVATDGASPVSFSLPPGNYQVALRHRNHLGVMTATAVTLGTSTTSVDLSLGTTTTYGTAARKSITGTFPAEALWAGDVTFNGQVKYTGSGNDRDPILTTVGSTTPNNTILNSYSTRDVNLNGQVKYTGTGNDRDPILVNVGSTTPNNVRVQQLP